MFKVFIISVFLYVYLTVLLRLFGKKEFSQLNVFDFVVFLVIFNMIQNKLNLKAKRATFQFIRVSSHNAVSIKSNLQAFDCIEKCKKKSRLQI